jgi:hypothetical protein
MQNIMNRKFVFKAIEGALCVGAMLLWAASASADTVVTFQVDMTGAISNALFNPTTNGIVARGTFDNWPVPGLTLTNNPKAANTNIYSGTIDDTSDANGATMNWQFAITTNGAVATYSSQADGDNYCLRLPATTGASTNAPVVFFDDDGAAQTNNITFQVDMGEQIILGNFNPSTQTLYCQGSFEGWSDTFQLTNNPAILHTNRLGAVSTNVYVGTYTLAVSPNAEEEYKYVIATGGNNAYESTTNSDPATGNRFFFNTNQTIPIVDYADLPISPSVTNNVTFEIDMTTQIAVGAFNTNVNSVEMHGDFNSWGSGQPLTNNPASSTPNIYSTVIQYMGAANAEHYFKYVVQPGTQWENVSAANSSGGNRYLFLLSTNGNLTNGPVYYSDASPSSLIDFVTVTNCMVTFTVNMTNAVGTDSVVFNTGDAVYINGLNNGVNNSFWTWGILSAPPQYQMTNIPNTLLYSITLPVAQGQQDDLIYKYSINGSDDEAGFADNHQRWIRSLPNYTMPVDTFGSQGASTQTELPAGNLKIGAAGSKVNLSWLGRRGVHLQTATNLLSKGTVWTDQLQTDGTNLIVAPGGAAATNYSVGQGNLYYRLVGPN